MAIIKNGILGGFKGKVGTVIGYHLKGQEIMRGEANERTKPFTEKELANQQRFGDLQYWLKPLTVFLRVGFQDYAPTFEGFVAAKSYNSKHALVKDDAGTHIDPALALVSFGDQEQATTASAVSEAENSITFNWEGGKCEGDDRAMFLVYDIEGATADFDTAAVKRRMRTGVFKLSEDFSGKAVHVYLAFVAEDRKRRSNSQYLGIVNVL
ncbi:DUF6266 family protein [Pedobacter heparinus]|uniref:DUF6266 family protein n=1 Tax=Pedobacter heparinus TaxID=984 RepID=UPI00292D78FB|nr:DUF6266 family protein [Pedobacter heparinus]